MFIDGPDHDAEVRRASDREMSGRLEDAGYAVIRFPYDEAMWPDLLKTYAWVFGTNGGEGEPS